VSCEAISLSEALELLGDEDNDVESVTNSRLMDVPSSSGAAVAIHNAIIAACGHNGAWEEALAVSWRVPGESHCVTGCA